MINTNIVYYIIILSLILKLYNDIATLLAILPLFTLITTLVTQKFNMILLLILQTISASIMILGIIFYALCYSIHLFDQRFLTYVISLQLYCMLYDLLFLVVKTIFF